MLHKQVVLFSQISLEHLTIFRKVVEIYHQMCYTINIIVHYVEEPMDCAIWLCRRKIFSADEINANFDIAAIRGYFLGGSLISWLRAHGGEAYADALSRLDPSDSALNDKLTEIFTQKKCSVPVHHADENVIRAVDMLKNSGTESPASSGLYGGSFSAGSFGSYLSILRWGSFSARYGSFGASSFSRSSFTKTWQWEWEWRFGSFRGGSFRSGSFKGGSFRYGQAGAFGSYSFGSFGFGSFRWANFGALPLGMLPSSYRGIPLGSFRAMTADEYDEIMYRCLNMCPLDRFGYGIHNI